jgi:hypothetical protein
MILEANQFFMPLLNIQLSVEKGKEKYLMAAGARYLSFANSIYDWSSKDNAILLLTIFWKGEEGMNEDS